jgi:hypothetical protein
LQPLHTQALARVERERGGREREWRERERTLAALNRESLTERERTLAALNSSKASCALFCRRQAMAARPKKFADGHSPCLIIFFMHWEKKEKKRSGRRREWCGE